MKINIEGSEYELLDSLIKTGNIKRIRNLQIQFHSWIDDSSLKRENIRIKLCNTHYETYCFPFIWENWTLKD